MNKKQRLQVIAYSLMILDHFFWVFYPSRNSFTFFIHLITRVSAPIFFSFAAEAMHHTVNKNKYILKLLFLTIISHYPYISFINNRFPVNFDSIFIPKTSIIFNLFLGSLLIAILEKKISTLIKLMFISLILFLSKFGDWPFFSVLSICFMYYAKDSYNKSRYFILLFVFTLGLSSFVSILNSSSSQWWWDMYIFGVLLYVPIYDSYEMDLKEKNNGLSRFAICIYPIHFILIIFIYSLL